jgi:hypothetical protein
MLGGARRAGKSSGVAETSPVAGAQGPHMPGARCEARPFWVSAVGPLQSMSAKGAQAGIS